MTHRFRRLFAVVALCGCVCTKSVAQKSITDSTSMDSPPSEVTAATQYFEAYKAKLKRDDKRALQLFEAFVKTNTTYPAAYYELSKLYQDQKNQAQAEIMIRKAVELDGANKWYKEQLIIVLAEQGKFAEAATFAASLVEAEPSESKYALYAADLFDRAKKFEAALKNIDIAITRSGNDDDMLLRKKDIYLHMNDVERAAGVVRELINQDPKNGRYYRLLADIYEENRFPEKALAIYKEAEQKIAGDPLVDIGLSEHYLKAGDTANFRLYTKRAITNNNLDAESQIQYFFSYIQGMNDSSQLTEGMPILEKLLTDQPSNPSLLAIYGEFLEVARQPAKAAEQYKKSLAIKPMSFAVWKDLLGLYAFSDVKQEDSLIRYSEKAMKLFPNQALAHYFNGLGRFNKKEYGKAIAAAERAIDMLPDNDIKTLALMYSFIGEVNNTNKQYEASDKAFDKALSFDPNDATVLNNYSYFLSERGKNLEKAKEMSEKSLRIRPNEATFLDTYGWIHYKSGDYQKAKELIEKAIKLAERRSDATLYDHLGDIYFKLNNSTKAIENWKTAKQKGSDNPTLDKKISEGKLYE